MFIYQTTKKGVIFSPPTEGLAEAPKTNPAFFSKVV